jgi:hypothetical protein
MSRNLLSIAGLICSALSDLHAAGPSVSQAAMTTMPLSFEPNRGQADSGARFIARTAGYDLRLEPAAAAFQFGPDKSSASIRMDLANANREALITGNSMLAGQADYFPSGDKSAWITNIPTYSRVHYQSIYPGIDVEFYGASNRLEYDFVVQAGADPSRIRIQFSGSGDPEIDSAGDLVLPLAKGGLRLLKPLVYQISSGGKARELVNAAYRIERKAQQAATVTFALGKYDHRRPLVIDPVIDPVVALSFSEYLANDFVAAVTVDGSGNAYVAGQASGGFYVTKFNSSGAVAYTATVGTGASLDPLGIAVGSSGQVYVAGEASGGSTVPASGNAYQSSPLSSYSAFLAVLSADGSMVPYATYLSGTNSTYNAAQGVAVDSSGNAYLTGYTYDASFPTTAGAYQPAFQPPYNGFVAKINPAAETGPASLIYSTLLGPGNTDLYGIAVDSAGDAYVTGSAPAGYPVTAGAFQYSGLYVGNGGVYVTKLNPSGTALLYSAYLGYGTGYGIAVEGQANPSAYVTGTVSGVDFPTTAGAYQTSYAGGFVTKLDSSGGSEVYSTFLGGPSSYAGGDNLIPWSIALPSGCASSCNAYLAGWTNTLDFPVINALESTPSLTGASGFVAEIAADGASALFSSYLTGLTSGISSAAGHSQFGTTPAIAVDSSGDMFVAANISGVSDFPSSISNGAPQDAVLLEIIPSATPFVLPFPAGVQFGNQPVGVSTAVFKGAATVRLNNLSSSAATLQPIQVSPSSVFSESDNCAGAIPAGGYCTLTLNFDPDAPSAFTGTVTITSNAANSPATIALSGAGYDTAFAEPSQSSVTFGNQAVGSSSTPQTLSIANLGDQTTALNIYTGTGDFSAVNNCPPQLLPGASCSASVSFSPTQAGLRTDTLTIISSVGLNASVSLSGSGTVSGGTSAITLSTTSLQFVPQAVGAASGPQTVYLTNSGSVPVVVQNYTASGDFAISHYNCGSLPFQLTPQQSCQIQITFSPTAAGVRSGTITVSDSATGSPQTIALSGSGVASAQSVEFYPSSSIAFPDTPSGATSANQLIYFYNTGSAAVTVDRVLVSGSFGMEGTTCQAATVSGVTTDGAGGGNCYVYVFFAPTSTGPQNGALTFIDSAPGSPHVVNLVANGITSTGTLALDPSGVAFAAQPNGTTSLAQNIYFPNPGNTPVTMTGLSFSGAAAGDYSVSSSNCAAPYTAQPGENACFAGIQFTPTAAGTRTATLTVASSAGTQTATLTGTGVPASQAVGLTPTSMNLGWVISGQNGPMEPVYLRNTGTVAVTFTEDPMLTGANPSAFVTSGGCGLNGYSLAPGASCHLGVSFAPSSTGIQAATLTFTDSAGTQSLALYGTGVSSTPRLSLSDYLISYDLELPGATSPRNTYLHFYNNGTTAVSMGSVLTTGPFVIPSGYDSCHGQTIAASSGSCYVYVQFAPTTAGYVTGTLVFKNSGGTQLFSVPLAGYAPAPTYSAYISPTALNFPVQKVIGTTSSSQLLYLYNSGNTAFTVGTLTGTNLGPAGPSAEFSLTATNGGYDGCSSQTVTAGSNCYVQVTFTPNAAGGRAGTITFPVTYNDSTQASFTANLSGTGVAEIDTLVLTPPNVTFIDQVVGTTSSSADLVRLNNTGNQPFTVGTLSNTNSAEFSLAATNGGADSCSGQVVAPAGSCYIYIGFTPNATGVRTGSVTLPVSFADHSTANAVLAMSGTGVAASKTLQISPANLQFSTELDSVTGSPLSVSVTNSGNTAVTIGTDSISTNPAEFAISSDSCAGRNLAPTAVCAISVTFTPGSSASGTQTGTLQIADNAAGGPHTLALSGIAISAAQQIAVSQTTLAFPNQAAGSASPAQVVYFTNQSDSNVMIHSIASGGANPADYTLSNNTCSGYFYARSTCSVSVQFVPPVGASGTLPAYIAESDASTAGTHYIVSLLGTAVAARPAAALNPASLTFPTQDVGSTSAAQYFSVTNTGSASLIVTATASSNATEFPISYDACSGTTLTPDQHCIVGVKFSPLLGGSRSGSIQVTDNAAGSPQSVAVTGTGYGIPNASLSPSSLAFGDVNIDARSARETITLTNPGTDTLVIAGIGFRGANASVFTQTNNCPGSLAPAAYCTVSISFKPTVAGTVGADLAITDNANNAAASVQVATLTGTGVAVPTAALAPNVLTFPSSDIGATSAAQAATLTNSGTGPLTIASIVLGGVNSGDFAETNNCGGSLVAGGSCTFSVTFTPSAAGSRSATITITDNANNQAGTTEIISLHGTGTAVPAAGVAPNVLAFSDTNVGVTSAPQTVTLSNSGTGPLTITGIAFMGSNPGDFGQTHTCGTSLAAGSNCSISVTFTPAAPGNRTATLVVTDNANNTSGSTQTASVSGTGIGVPVAVVGPSALTFPSTNVGTTSSSMAVTLNNTGTGPLSITSIGIGASNPGDFAETNNCGSSVAVSGSCTIAVTFTPTAPGARTASLQVIDNSNNTGSIQTVSLSGAGVGVPAAGISPPSITFAAQPLNSTSPVQAVTLGNTGTGPLSIASIAFGGANPGDFAQINNCGSSLAAASSCTIDVTFTPAAVGSASATLIVTDNTGNVAGSTQSVPLSGSTPPPTVTSLSPTSGNGLMQTFTAVYGDLNGIADLRSVNFLVNTSTSFANACAVVYATATNTMYLYNDAGTTASAVTPGSSESASNSQCTLNGASSSFSASSDSLTLNVSLTFSGTFTGRQYVLLRATGAAATSGWTGKGVYTP